MALEIVVDLENIKQPETNEWHWVFLFEVRSECQSEAQNTWQDQVSPAVSMELWLI